MTSNQIAYWKLKEEERANRVREAETERSNRAKEFISQREADASMMRAATAEKQRSNENARGISKEVREWMFDLFPTGGEVVGAAGKVISALF